ncbi:retrovirus-related Pol polyprotein from transposon 17.6 [Trichonephila clavipes]|nr:retrovirus-related Pol polyprotein from transposon 17.6 [Trichonephila clavipes]
MDRWGRNDKILTYSGIKEKENRFGKTSPRLGASVPESTRERTFEKRVIQRCYHCNMPGHIKAGCPKLIKNKTTETLNNIEGNENPDFLNSYTTKGSVNGHEIDILRDTGATIDLVCAKYINPSSFSGENVWVKQPLSPELVCLPLAVVEISGNFGTVQTKAAVCGNHLNQHGRYLLGNKTAELIKGNLGYNFLPVEILNAVQTRSQVKAAREERGIDSGDAKKGKMRVTRENLINAQKNSEEIKPLYEQAASQVQVTNQVYSLEKELLVKNREDKLGNVVKLIVVPEGLRDPIKSLCHEGTSAHLGITKSKDKLNRYFYWPNCYRDMEQFVKTCDQCQRAGKPNDKKKAPLKLVPVIQEVFTKLNIDACGPLPITSKGNRYLITAICMSSKFPEAIPVTDISSVSVTDALLNIFSRMGFPREIQCDQGTSFTSALTTEFFERFGILVRHSSVYHPQSNSVERFHRTLKRLLRVLCLDAGSEWDKHLPSILLALRTVSPESTGYTPSELVYGKNLRTPETLVMEHWMEPEEEGDLVTEYMFKLINRLKRCQEVAINKMEEMQVKRKTWYDKNAVKREFKDGDLVLVLATSRANKLAVQWIGPGTILNKISETNYLVEFPGRRETSQIYHINMLKPYYKRPEHVNASELNKHLHDKQMDRLRELLNKYSKCFSNNPGLTNLVEHEIQLVSDQPVRTKPYRMSHRQNEILKNEINRMLKLGIIEVGESDYMSPMILVEGYWQIPLSKTAQRYAAFCTSFGTYRPLRMSFGLKNAPYFFSKLMAELLNGLEDFVVPYLDDIAIFSDTWESHIKHMETVLQRIKRAKLTIKPSKCKFAQQNVKFFGSHCGSGFSHSFRDQSSGCSRVPYPSHETQIRAFLGIAGYYQKYINLFSVIAAPLTDALKGRAKKGEIKWTTECENAFRELKGKLIDKPVLYAPNFEREFIVQTDASNAGMGAVLTQLTEQGEEHPILYLIMTDHNPLVWLNRNVSSNPRLMRWALALQPYNFRIVHRSGKSHKKADSLSRSVIDN